MKKLLFGAVLLVSLLVVSGPAPAASKCDTRYPVVLAHGMGASAEILGIVDYWWGIEEALEANGAEVYITSVNGMDSTANKAESFKKQFLQILAVSGKEKANIIGHSHGTLYTRDAISNLGLADKVSSYTSLAGPHQGSSVADAIMYGVPGFLHGVSGQVMDFLYSWVFGDTDPNSLENGWNVTRPYMKDVFNPNTPNVEGLYYQSWASKARYSCPSGILQLTWLYALTQEGSNDGLVSVESAKWGNFRGVEDGSWWSPGVDHLNLVNQFFGITPGFDAKGFYVDMVADLKSRGY